MNFYRYKSVDRFGKYVNGRIQAENQLDLTAILKSSGQELISFREEKKNFLEKVNQNYNHFHKQLSLMYLVLVK